MRIQFFKSKWERAGWSLSHFLREASREEFDGVELPLFLQKESTADIGKMVADSGLRLIAQVVTRADTQKERLTQLHDQFDSAEQAQACRVNGFIGLDFAPQSENLSLVLAAIKRAKEAKIDFSVETHRGRMCYSAANTASYLQELPQLRLTADFSHWTCVSESGLQNQNISLDKAIAATDHIHARVGFDQGPQVPDPFAPEYLPWLERFMSWWQRIIQKRSEDGFDETTITPEFGPVPYAWAMPRTSVPIIDPWAVNLKMRDYLRDNLQSIDPI